MARQSMNGSSDRRILLVVDVQNDFCPGGALAAPGADRIVPAVNRLARSFAHVALTQDWHPPGHLSFAGSHPGKAPFETVEAAYGPQILWPDHCVQGTRGAAFHPALEVPHAELVLRKGYDRRIDSYSAFRENDHKTPTGLAAYLRERGFERLVLCGIATDFCVLYSALDAVAAGFTVEVAPGACAGIDMDGSLARALEAMRQAGVRFV
ncbi:MAG TPA: bifunctional nicotinamidase/pyrazinamidase [Stellaceae bacterium]|nr:bifunctional nicotinamidase/pyrazinamidase [Stellaceae bacterium]